MTLTDEHSAASTPASAVMNQPRTPADYHDHPFVWAWYVTLSTLDPDFIRARCKEAQEQDAPPDAVYKTNSRDPLTPDTWITVEQLHEDNRAHVTYYGNALLKWEQAWAAHHRRETVQPQPLRALPAGARVLTLDKRAAPQH